MTQRIATPPGKDMTAIRASVLPTVADLALMHGVRSIQAVLSPAANAVLSDMEALGLELDEALSLAQEGGVGPENLAREIDGRDAAGRLALLAQVAWGGTPDPQEMACLGLVSLRAADVRRAAAEGLRYRLVARATPACGSVEVRALTADHPLHGVDGHATAVMVTTSDSRIILIRPR